MGKVLRPWRAEALVRLPAGWRYEIDEGQLVIVTPAGMARGRITAAVTVVLSRIASAGDQGQVLAGEPGFYLRQEPSLTLRAPDIAFLSRERLAQLGDESGFGTVPPDLAVEIHAPDELDMQRKVEQYLAAGVRSA